MSRKWRCQDRLSDFFVQHVVPYFSAGAATHKCHSLGLKIRRRNKTLWRRIKELLILATLTTQQLKEYVTICLLNHQKAFSKVFLLCSSESWWGITNKSCWRWPLSHHRSSTKRAFFCCGSVKRASFAELRVCFAFLFSSKCLHPSLEVYVNTPLWSCCSCFVLIFASFLHSENI